MGARQLHKPGTQHDIMAQIVYTNAKSLKRDERR